MNLLLDTHALIWLSLSPDRLSETAAAAIRGAGADVYASHVSLWEIAIKRGLGRLTDVKQPATAWFERVVPASGLRELPLSAAHLGAVEHLPRHHGDPFDRLLVCQAAAEGLTLISADPAMARYAVDVLW